MANSPTESFEVTGHTPDQVKALRFEDGTIRLAVKDAVTYLTDEEATDLGRFLVFEKDNGGEDLTDG